MHEVISVKHNQAIGLAPIFKPLRRGERKESKLDVSIESGSEKIRITCFEPLGADDQTALFSILSLCTDEGRGLVLSHAPKTEAGQALRADLFLKRSSKEDSVMVEASEYELLKLSGGSTDGSENYERFRDVLARLASVSIRVQSHSEDYVVRLLAYHVDKETGRLKIAVNNKSASAILGDQYAYIDLSDHRKLTFEPAKILHGWLSSWMGQGNSRRIGLDKLAAHIYPNFEGVATSSKATYRSNTKRAVEGLSELGWKVATVGRGSKAMVTIARPKPAPLLS